MNQTTAGGWPSRKCESDPGRKRHAHSRASCRRPVGHRQGLLARSVATSRRVASPRASANRLASSAAVRPYCFVRRSRCLASSVCASDLVGAGRGRLESSDKGKRSEEIAAGVTRRGGRVCARLDRPFRLVDLWAAGVVWGSRSSQGGIGLIDSPAAHNNRCNRSSKAVASAAEVESAVEAPEGVHLKKVGSVSVRPPQSPHSKITDQLMHWDLLTPLLIMAVFVLVWIFSSSSSRGGLEGPAGARWAPRCLTGKHTKRPPIRLPNARRFHGNGETMKANLWQECFGGWTSLAALSWAAPWRQRERSSYALPLSTCPAGVRGLATRKRLHPA